MRTLFVVTQGRTGSSLLQMALNEVRGARIVGEDGGYLRDMYRAHLRLADRRERLRIPGHVLSTGHPHFGIDSVDDPWMFMETRRASFARWWPAGRIDFRVNGEPYHVAEPWLLGQKEIRWDGEAHLQWTRDVFGPETGFIFLYRNVEHIAQSGWYATSADPLGLAIAKAAHVFKMEVYARDAQMKVLALDYEDLKDAHGDGWDRLNKFLITEMAMDEAKALSSRTIERTLGRRASF